MAWTVNPRAIHNPHKLGEFRHRVKRRTGRVLVVRIGNSNEQIESYGHNYGSAYALDNIHGGAAGWACYTDGPVGVGDPNGQRFGYGGYPFSSPAGQSFASAPAAWLPYVDNIPANTTKWLGAGQPWYRHTSGAAPSNSGYMLSGGAMGEVPTLHPLGVSNALRARYQILKDSVNGPTSVTFNVRKWSGQDELAQITIQGATGGTFTITVGANTTAALAYDAAAATVQTAVQALASVGSGNCTVTKNTVPVGVLIYNLSFGGALAGTNVVATSASGASLTGPSPSVAVTIEQGAGGFFTELASKTINNAGTTTTPTIIEETISIAAATREYSIMWSAEKQGTSPSDRYLLHSICIDRPEITSGWGVCQLVYLPGDASTSDGLVRFATRLQNVSNEHLTSFLQAARRGFLIDGQKPCLLFCVEEGVNSRNDSVNSVGPSPAASNTAAGFEDNLQAIWNRIYQVYALNGWDQSEWSMIVEVSPQTQADDADLSMFRQAARDFSDLTANCAAVDRTRLVENFAEAQTYWATGGTDSAHLTVEGYQRYNLRLMQCVVASSGTETLRGDLRQREPDRRRYRGVQSGRL